MKRRKISGRKKTGRRVGAISFRREAQGAQRLLMQAVGTIIGGAAGKMVDNAIPDTVDQRLVAVAKIAGGYMVASRIARGNAVIEGVGIGMAASGGADLAQGVGIIKGLPTKYYMTSPLLNGGCSDEQRFLAGNSPSQLIAGLGKVINS